MQKVVGSSPIIRSLSTARSAAIRLDSRIAEERSLTSQRAILMLLLATCERALEAFQAADNVVDRTFVVDLERIIERSRRELDAVGARLAAES